MRHPVPTYAAGAQAEAWTECVIYGLTAGHDGAFPIGDLAEDPGTDAPYRMASAAGANKSSAADCLTPPRTGTWRFTPLYGFGATHTDGVQP
jgi:hypothetical protein